MDAIHERYYQAKAEREAYLRAIPEADRIGWATSSPNAAWHSTEHCQGAGNVRNANRLPVDERYVRVHKLHRCGFCNRKPVEHHHVPDDCDSCRRLWVDGFESGDAAARIEGRSLTEATA